MKKLLLGTLLASCLFYGFVNAAEPESYSQEAKQAILEKLRPGDYTLKPNGNSLKLYDKKGNLIMEMNLNLKNNEKISFSEKNEQKPWKGVPWYVYDEDGERYEMTDAEKEEFFMGFSHPMLNFMGQIQ